MIEYKKNELPPNFKSWLEFWWSALRVNYDEVMASKVIKFEQHRRINISEPRVIYRCRTQFIKSKALDDIASACNLMNVLSDKWRQNMRAFHNEPAFQLRETLIKAIATRNYRIFDEVMREIEYHLNR